MNQNVHRKPVLLLLLLLGINAAGFSGSDPANKGTHTEKYTSSPYRLRNDLSYSESFIPADKIFASFLKRWEVPGASVAIAKDGKLVFAKGYGTVSRNEDIEIQPFNLFRIASVSKLITAVAIMHLEERGELSLDEKVFGKEGILNDSVFVNPRDTRALSITVSHLLNHSGGWTRRWGDHMFIPHAIAEFMNVPSPPDTRTIVKFALSKKLHFTPGTYRSYSNLGYSILGLVIEEVTGQTYEDFVKSEILMPLGIYDMQMGRNMAEGRAELEVKYSEPKGADSVLSIYESGEMVSRCYGGNDIESLEAAGGWLASAPELLRFVLAVDGDPSKPDILHQKNIELMTNPSLGMAPVGWKVSTTDGTWWRTGSFAGTSAMVKRQNDGFTWIVLLNSSTWKASTFPGEINKTMRKVLSTVHEWPDYDLFRTAMPETIPMLEWHGF